MILLDKELNFNELTLIQIRESIKLYKLLGR